MSADTMTIYLEAKQMKLAIDLCIAQVTAPWQPLADNIRSEMRLER